MARKKRDGATAAAMPRLVVGVGASAGGLEAFKELLGVLPADSGMAYILIQHLDPHYKSILAELLAPCTPMRVRDAEQGAVLAPDTIYIIRPDTALAVEGGRIELTEPTLHRGVRLPVDHLFRSLAREFGPRAVGVVLSGAGSDGTAGLREIRNAGGLTVAQSPDEATQPGMPQSAVDAGVVDVVVAIREMPAVLERFAALPPEARLQAVDDEAHDADDAQVEAVAPSEEQLVQLAAVLEARRDFDIRQYKSGTIKRRVRRRMLLAGQEDFDAYLDLLRADPTEQQLLSRDLLISVTEFFRDAEAFEALRALAVAPIVRQAEAGETVRVWAAGCATGEEAYSLGMLFFEEFETQQKRLGLQIFATEVDEEALAVARAALYPPSIAERISPGRLERFFLPRNGKGYEVRPRLRDAVSFASHDLTRDPPFSRMHLVTSRNVLIYLRPQAQEHVLRTLHFALLPDAYLFLGSSETLGKQRHLFATLSKPWRIYQKVGASRPLALPASRPARVEEPASPASPERRALREPGAAEPARRAAMRVLMAPAVVVAGDGTVIFTHGELAPYLRFPDGEPRLEFSSMIRPDLSTRARAVLYRCRREGAAIDADSSPDGERARRTRIRAAPAPEAGEGAVVISFEELDAVASASAAAAPESPAQEAVIDQLERELKATREDLRNTVEELETSNEELRASNEEAMSMNEELQSANEELEATSEELRSLNEELTTVNAQLRDKVDQLEQAHDDLTNFFASARLPLVYLDEQLRLKRFSPAAEELLRIDHGDEGRFVGDVARELLQHDLAAEARGVFSDLAPCSRELRSGDGRWWLRRVVPYRTETRRIDGVVVSLLDVTDLKDTTERLRAGERRQAVIARLGLRALEEADLQGFLDHAVREVQQVLGSDYCKILELQPGEQSFLLRAGAGWREDLVGAALVPAGLESQAGFTLRAAEVVQVAELAAEKRFSGPALLLEHGVTSGLTCTIRSGEGAYGVLGVHTRNRRTFTLEEANFLLAIAAVVAAAVGRQQTRVRLALEAAASQAIAEASSFELAVRGVLDAFAAGEAAAALGELWCPEASGEGLARRYLAVHAPLEAAAAAQAFPEQRFAAGEDVIGRVWQSGEAEWFSEPATPGSSRRSDGAQRLGLVSGFAFALPARAGVLAAFSTRRLAPSASLLRSLTGIGRQLGDLTRRLETERELRDSERRFRQLLKNAPLPIFAYDAHGTILETSDAWHEATGYGASEVPSVQEWSRLALEGDPDEFLAALQGEPAPASEFTLRTRSGEWRTYLFSAAPLGVLPHGREARVCAALDVTEVRRTHEALRAADRQKDQFIAMLGHELRNPLAAIRTATELLRRTAGEDRDVQQIEGILSRQGLHMTRLIDGLLDVSRIVRGKINLEFVPLDLREVVREAVADREEALRDKGIEVHVELPPQPLTVLGDRVRLCQILDNLLGNALKFTEAGGRVAVLAAESDAHAEVRVRDTGVGIPEELRPLLFRPFQQGPQELARNSGGLGLGLALARGLAERHEGTLELAEPPGAGHGAEFVLRLPLSQPPADAQAQGGGAALPALRLLLIEDNADAAQMLGALLAAAGHQIELAPDGIRALELLDGAPRFDAVLCDIGLPGMDGYEFARLIRSRPALNRLRLVALTGYGQAEDVGRSVDAGFDAHLTKPVELRALESILAPLVDPKR